MNTLAKLVTETINSLEAQNQPQPTKMEMVDDVDDAPRWLSDAEREGLPTVNLTDTGAPLLDRDAILRRSYPDCVRSK